MKPWFKTVEAEARRRRDRDPRVAWGGLAVLVDQRGDIVPVIVENVSVDGFLVQSDVRLQSGGKYTMQLPKENELNVTVLWTQGRFSGGKIDRRANEITGSARLDCDD